MKDVSISFLSLGGEGWGEGDSEYDSHPLSASGGIFNLVLPLKEGVSWLCFDFVAAHLGEV